MTEPELRDYIAIQAMAAMLHNESMATNHAIDYMRDPTDTTSAEWMAELTYGSFEIADAMIAARRDRNDPRFRERIAEDQAAKELADEMEDKP